VIERNWRARSEYKIWPEGPGPDGALFRWTFSEFSDERVRWQGFVSRDEGRTWIRDEEIILRRCAYAGEALAAASPV
jgi:hypothetical protein